MIVEGQPLQGVRSAALLACSSRHGFLTMHVYSSTPLLEPVFSFQEIEIGALQLQHSAPTCLPQPASHWWLICSSGGFQDILDSKDYCPISGLGSRLIAVCLRAGYCYVQDNPYMDTDSIHDASPIPWRS